MSNEATFLKLNSVRRSFEDHVIANVRKIDRTKVADNIIVSFKVDRAGNSVPSVIFDIYSNILKARLALIEIATRGDEKFITLTATHNVKTNLFKLSVNDIHSILTKNQILVDDLREYINSHFRDIDDGAQSFNPQVETLTLSSSGDINGGLKKLLEDKKYEVEAISLLKEFMEKNYSDAYNAFDASSDNLTARYTITSKITHASISFSIDKKTRWTSTLIGETRQTAPDYSIKDPNENLMNIHKTLSKLWVMCVEKLEICPIVFMRNCGVAK